MKELLQSFFKTTEERIRNPFIGAFMTSWLFFNWKPIVFLFLSSKTIENKIAYIEKNFSNIWLIFILPIISAFFYVLVLPYLNLLFEELLKYSLLKRNYLHINKQKQSIENQKQLAIEEIKLEEAKTEFRERKTHNQLVEDLQKKNKEYEELIEIEKNRNLTTIEDFKNEMVKKDEITLLELKNSEKRYNESRLEIVKLSEQLYDKEKRINNLTTVLNNETLTTNEYKDSIENQKNINSNIIKNLEEQISKKSEIITHDRKNFIKNNDQLNFKIKELSDENSRKEKLIQDLSLMLENEKLNKSYSESSIIFDNGLELVERYEGNKVFYFDNEKKHLYTDREINQLMEKFKYKRLVK